MAISTYKIFLMKKGTGDTYEKLIDIIDYPDLGGAPEQLDATTLSDGTRKYIEGIQDISALTFNANYTKTDYDKLLALKGETMSLAIFIGGTVTSGTLVPDGSNGKFGFDGTISVYLTGGGVNEVVKMVITVTPSSEIITID